MTHARGERETIFPLPRLPGTRGIFLGALAILLAGILHPSPADGASRRPVFRLVKQIDLPRIGLQIQVMSEAQETPVAPPSVFTYQFSNGAASGKVDMYAPRDLWLQSQQAGRWIDNHSNTLTLATITLPLPAGFPMPHARKEDYDKRVAELQAAPMEWTPETLATWVADFTGAESVKAHSVAKHPANLRDLAAFSIAGQPHRLAYTFRLNRAATGQSRAVPTCFLALFDINPGIDIDSAIETIQADFLPKLTSSKTPPPAAAGPSATFQTAPASTHTARSPEYIASRDQVAASIKNMADWWYVETANYIILSDLETKNRSLVKELQEDIECLRDAFEQFMPPKEAVRSVSVIRVFADSKEYERYVPAAYAWTSGIWMPDKKELVIRPATAGSNKQQREMVLQVAFHEAFHQYIFYAMDQLQSAPWFNEGYASFFGTASLGSGRISVEENEAQAKRLEERLAGGPIDLNRFLHLTYREFYGDNDATRNGNYALAWGLVYYLRKAAPLEQHAPYARILESYVDALWQTREADKATDAAFQGVNFDKFTRDFAKFWESRSKRSAASRNRIFKDYRPADAAP